MKPAQHTAISIVLSGILHLIFRSWGLTVASLISGIIVDLDFIIDYSAQCGINYKIKNIYQTYCENQLLKVRLFHGWEWLFIWGLVALVTDWNPWIIGIWFGFGQHIYFDYINYGERIQSYSLIWRWKNGFKSKIVFPEKFQADSRRYRQ